MLTAIPHPTAESNQTVAMLHEAIYLVGKFTEANPSGRKLVVDSGGFATILPILCKLPFRYDRPIRSLPLVGRRLSGSTTHSGSLGLWC